MTSLDILNTLNTLNTLEYNSAGIIFTDETHVLAGYQKNKFYSGIGGKKELSDLSVKFTAIREMLEELFGFEMIEQNLETEKKIENNIEELLLLKDTINLTFQNSTNSIITDIKKQVQSSLDKEITKYKIYNNKLNNEQIKQLIHQIESIHIEKYIYHGGYVNFIFDFDKTIGMLEIIKSSGMKSKYYDSIPNNIFEIINKRKTDIKGEISYLALFPIKNIVFEITDTQKTVFDDYFITDLNKLIENKDIYSINYEA
jgi:hypothetical protein